MVVEVASLFDCGFLLCRSLVLTEVSVSYCGSRGQLSGDVVRSRGWEWLGVRMDGRKKGFSERVRGNL